MTPHHGTIATSKLVCIRIFFLDKLLIVRGGEKTGVQDGFHIQLLGTTRYKHLLFECLFKVPKEL